MRSSNVAPPEDALRLKRSLIYRFDLRMSEIAPEKRLFWPAFREDDIRREKKNLWIWLVFCLFFYWKIICVLLDGPTLESILIFNWFSRRFRRENISQGLIFLQGLRIMCPMLGVKGEEKCGKYLPIAGRYCFSSGISHNTPAHWFFYQRPGKNIFWKKCGVVDSKIYCDKIVIKLVRIHVIHAIQQNQ